MLAELTAHTTVIVTAGNHDSAIRLGFGAAAVHRPAAGCAPSWPIGRHAGAARRRPTATVAIYPLPYLDPDAARTALARPTSRWNARTRR